MMENATFEITDHTTGEVIALDEQQTEIFQYICQMLQFITTGDEENDQEYIDLLADGITERATHLHESYQAQMKDQNKRLTKDIKKA